MQLAISMWRSVSGSSGGERSSNVIIAQSAAKRSADIALKQKYSETGVTMAAKWRGMWHQAKSAKNSAAGM